MNTQGNDNGMYGKSGFHQPPPYSALQQQQQQQQQMMMSWRNMQTMQPMQPWHTQQPWFQPAWGVTPPPYTASPAIAPQSVKNSATPQQLPHQQHAKAGRGKRKKKAPKESPTSTSVSSILGVSSEDKATQEQGKKARTILPPGCSPPSSPSSEPIDESKADTVQTTNAAVHSKQSDDSKNAKIDKGLKRKRPENSGKRPSKRQQLTIPLAPKYLAAQKVGTSPEEIARWREARRRNYPTQANIDRKAKEEQEAPPPQQDDVEKEQVQEVQAMVEKEEAGMKHRPKKLCNNFFKGSCRFGKRCKFLHDEEERTRQRIERRKNAEKKQFLHATARPGGHPSLLRQLLAVDIIKERTVILECIHHMLRKKAQELKCP